MSGDRKVFYLVHDQARQGAVEAIRNAPAGWSVTIEPPKRTLAQNDKMWGMLGNIAVQMPSWAGAPMNKYDYKDLMTGSMEHIRFVPAYDCPGRIVGLGQSTKKQDRKYFSDLFILMEKFGADYGIRYADATYRDYIISDRQGVPV